MDNLSNWFEKNYKWIIITAFLIPIIIVAAVSISHVTEWYGITNPYKWAIYLSVGIEIAALSALAAISVKMGSKVYFPFAIVTIIQFIGNVFFSYNFIDQNSNLFINWVELSGPILEYLGVETAIDHKRFLAFFAGGLLPMISLSFLHMLVKFTEDENKNPSFVNNDDSKDESQVKPVKTDMEKEKEELERQQLFPLTDEHMEKIAKHLESLQPVQKIEPINEKEENNSKEDKEPENLESQEKIKEKEEIEEEEITEEEVEGFLDKWEKSGQMKIIEDNKETSSPSQMSTPSVTPKAEDEEVPKLTLKTTQQPPSYTEEKKKK